MWRIGTGKCCLTSTVTEKERKKHQEEIALFRYGVISELLQLTPGTEAYRGEFCRLVGKRWRIPGTKRTRIAAQTIRDWMKKYRAGGFAGLHPKERLDMGKRRRMSVTTQEILLGIKSESPKLSVRLAIRKARETEGMPEDETLPPSTVHRLFANEGLMKPKIESPMMDRRRFSYEHANELWMSDVQHGPRVPDGRGRKRKTYLINFIDDATRMIAHAEFMFSESAKDFVQVFKEAVKRLGIPQRLYVDNGGCYISNHLKRIAANLGIALINARPRSPEGKGKIERFFRRVNEQFIADYESVGHASLGEINERLLEWVHKEYHQTPHHGIGKMTPLDKWCESMDTIRHVDSHSTIDDLFLFEEDRKVYGDRTVRLHNRIYEVDLALVGKKVRLRYDPSAPPERPIQVKYEGKDFGMAHPVDPVANAHSKRMTNPQIRFGRDTGETQ